MAHTKDETIAPGLTATRHEADGDRRVHNGYRKRIFMAFVPSSCGTSAFRSPPIATPREPPPSPEDPELRRRVDIASRQLERIRRQLKRHLRPDRRRHPSGDREADHAGPITQNPSHPVEATLESLVPGETCGGTVTSG
jgi:hypothetical protein